MITKHQGEPKDCECSTPPTETYIISADEVYSKKDKKEMIEEDISWDFHFDLCSKCDGIVGIIG